MDDQLATTADAGTAVAASCAPAPARPPQSYRFTFTGSGAEYFRIWVVNLLLTVLTLGVYSAWGKVRRLQYFDRNTQLAGASFDFSGDPKAVLRGRVLGVLLLAAYQYAFGFSAQVGIAVIVILLLALPFLMRGALRFRLSNTSYRGLPFGFAGSIKGAYLSYLPPIATFLVPGALVTLYPESLLGALVFALYLAWPWMHGVARRYQHDNMRYGDAASHYTLPARRFFMPYFRAGLLVMGGLLLLTLAGGIMAALGLAGSPARGMPVEQVVVMALSAYVFYVLAGPFLAVRLGNLAWSNTWFPGVRIDCDMGARAFMRLQTANVLLTLATLGLYRPFAVVRIYQYRLAHLTLTVDGGLERIAAGTALRPGAAGDGVADFLGVDLSW